VLRFLALQLAQRMHERAEAGLHRDYREQLEQGPFLHGRLDVPAQLRQGPARKEQLHCRFDDFTSDIPCNQLPCWTAQHLLALPVLDPSTRLALQQAVADFAGFLASPLPENPPEVKAAPAEYEPLLQLCRLLAEALSPGCAGPGQAPAFLLDLDRLFESYLTRQVREAFAGAEPGVAVQPTHVIAAAQPGQPDFVLRPDLVLARQGRPACVIDAKWKVLPRLLTDDLYQITAYCTALAAPWGVLVYPSARDRFWSYTLGAGTVQIGIATLRVVGDLDRCQRSCRRLLRRLAALTR
jgi:5-methylcytosine-specific restriction enzyme subunit McrC